MIWIDQESGTAADSATVIFVEAVSSSLSSANPNDLIQLSPPTYCRNGDDAERLVKLLERVGVLAELADEEIEIRSRRHLSQLPGDALH